MVCHGTISTRAGILFGQNPIHLPRSKLRRYQDFKILKSSNVILQTIGFILFAAGVIVTYFAPDKKSVIAYSTLAGAIVEIISGLFFWLYSQTIKQINIFHNRLIETQQILTAIQTVNKISRAKRDEAYANIIDRLRGKTKSKEP